MLYTTIQSPMGELLLTGEEGALRSVWFGGAISARWRRESSAFRAAAEQLAEYFAGQRRSFDLAMADDGSPFQRRVWDAVDAIPYGRTVTYGELAAQVGVPRDRVRAVAAAIGANRLLIVRPCHRVIGADGSLTGYAGGVERKLELLTLEGALQPALSGL